MVKGGLSVAKEFVESTQRAVRLIQKTNKIRAVYDTIVEQHKTRQLRHFSETRYAGAMLMGANFVANEVAIKEVRQKCLDSADDTMRQFSKVDFPDSFFNDWRDLTTIFAPVMPLVTALSTTYECTASLAFPAMLSLSSCLAVAQPATNRGRAVRERTIEAQRKYFHDVLALSANQSAVGAGDILLIATALSPQTVLLSHNAVTKVAADNVLIAAVARLERVFKQLFPKEFALVESECIETYNSYTWLNSALWTEYKLYRGHRPFQTNLTVDTDPFKWWAGVKMAMPRLFMLARATLCFPATSTPVERMWNKTKRVFTKLRGRLNPELGGKQVLVRELWDWLAEGGEKLLLDVEARRAPQ